MLQALHNREGYLFLPKGRKIRKVQLRCFCYLLLLLEH